MTTQQIIKPRYRVKAGSRPAPNAQYLRPDSSNFLRVPAPVLRDSSMDVRMAYRQAAGYAIDAVHNSGWIAGAIDQVVSDTNGNKLKLNANPNARSLGWSEDFAENWALEVEESWSDYSLDAYQCDARGEQTIPQMADSGMRMNYSFGEYLATNELIQRAGTDLLLKVKIHTPLALSQDTNEQIRLQQGILKDRDGMPVAYRFRKATDGFEKGTIDIRARDTDGRQNVIHIFDGMPGQTRGITPLAPILKVTRQYDQLSDATLTASLIQTIFAASLKSTGLTSEAFQGLLTESEQEGSDTALPGPPGMPGMSDYINSQVDWYSQFKLNLGSHGRLAQLFPGQELEFHSSEHPADNYLPFVRNLLREVARAIGVTYESLSLDNEGATYSSLLHGIATIWPLVIRRRERISVRFYQAVYQAWLDEMIFRRKLPFPGGYSEFKNKRAAACRASFRGPPKPRADELKSARAQTERLENGSTSLSAEANENGQDVEDLAREKARDKKIHAKHGLPDPYPEKGEKPPMNANGEREDEVDG